MKIYYLQCNDNLDVRDFSLNNRLSTQIQNDNTGNITFMVSKTNTSSKAFVMFLSRKPAFTMGEVTTF